MVNTVFPIMFYDALMVSKSEAKIQTFFKSRSCFFQKCTQIENIIGFIFALILRIKKISNGD